MSELTLYGSIMTPPVRSVQLYLTLSSIPFTFKDLNPLSGDTRTEEFTKINPFQAIPAIVHNDYNLWESAAIISYLSEVYNIDNTWYPKDAKLRGRVNAYLHWHHQGVREKISNYMYPKLVAPKFQGAPELTEEQDRVLRGKFNEFLEDFKWLIRETGFVARTERMTIADIFAYEEMCMALRIFNIEEHREIKEWFEKVDSVDEVKRLTEQALEIIAKLF